LAVLTACGDIGARPPADASFDAEQRSLICDHAGTSSVAGRGPYGPLDGAQVYAQVLNGFCGNILVLTIANESPLQWPMRDDTAIIRVEIPELGGETSWSGSYDVVIEAANHDTHQYRGTLEVELGTPSYVTPTQVRATARFTGVWDLTATIDAPYCGITTCF
jgi:hypothetical protein